MASDCLKAEVIDLDSSMFLWAVFAADLGYIPLAIFQRFYAKTYPATRHHSDYFSITVIAVHVICGAMVIFGGCYCWLAMQYWNNPIATPIKIVADTLAMAAIGHSISNLFLLRKVPGERVLNVPLYIFSTVYNAHRAWCVLMSISGPEQSISGPEQSISGLELSISGPEQSMSGPEQSISGLELSISGPELSISGLERELMLLWCAVSTFIWVRYFIVVVGSIAGTRFTDFYDIIYSLALPFAGVLGVLVPAELLGGVDSFWTIAFLGAGPILGPPMPKVHKFCFKAREWPWVRSWGFSRWVVQFILETTNPKAYHGEGIGNSAANISVEKSGRKTE